MTVELLLHAWLLGIAVAAPIGPVNLEIIRRALRYRLLAGFLVGLGATLIDFSYLVLTSAGLLPFLQNDAFRRVAFFLGGGLLLFLGFIALRDAWKQIARRTGAEEESVEEMLEESPPRILPRSFATGLAMTATNPMTIAFWATMPAVIFGDTPPRAGGILLAGLFVWAGAMSWVLTLMAVLKLGRRFARRGLLLVAGLLGGLIMGWFGARFVVRAILPPEAPEKPAAVVTEALTAGPSGGCIPLPTEPT